MGYQPIRTKSQMLSLLRAGELGNTLRTWDSPDKVNADYRGLLGVRSRRIGGSGPFATGLTIEQVWQYWHKCLDEGWRARDLFVSEAAPHDSLIISGELDEEAGQWNLRYSHRQLPMRQAFMAEEKAAKERLVNTCNRAVRATPPLSMIGTLLPRLYLQSYLDPDSFEWLKILLDRYPEHIVEFSAFSTDLGVIPHRNTIIWEVRRY